MKTRRILLTLTAIICTLSIGARVFNNESIVKTETNWIFDDFNNDVKPFNSIYVRGTGTLSNTSSTVTFRH